MTYTIEIRDSVLLFTSSKKKSGSVAVNDCFQIPLSKDSEMDARVLKHALNERKIIKSKVDLIINDRTALTKVLVVPKVDRKRMALIVKNELISSLNMKEDCVVDYLNIESFDTLDGSFERVLAVALKRSVIERWEKFLNSTNLKIKTVQTFASSIVRVFDHLELIPSNCPSLIVDICQDYSRFYLYINSKFTVLRTVYANEINREESILRYLNLIRLISNSLAKNQEKELKSIKLFGEDKFVIWLYEAISNNLNHSIELINHGNLNFPQQENCGNYLYSLGVHL